MNERIRDFLMGYFSDVYCDTCIRQDTDKCEYCHRKSMLWGISNSTAEYCAIEIGKIAKDSLSVGHSAKGWLESVINVEEENYLSFDAFNVIAHKIQELEEYKALSILENEGEVLA